MKSKIRTMKSMQEPTDDEIQRYKDFDKLLLEREKLVARQKQLTRIKITGAALVLLLGSAVWYFGAPDKSGRTSTVPVEKTTADTATENAVAETPGIQNIDHTDKQPATSETPDDKPAKRERAQTQERSAQATEVKPSGDTKVVYQQPEPVNGYPDLYAYFDRELTYPKSAVNDSVQGEVTVVFSVNAEGKADDIRIENSLGKAFDDEVFRIIRNMPPWRPAYYNGKLVKSKVSLPLTFQLRKVNSQN